MNEFQSVTDGCPYEFEEVDRLLARREFSAAERLNTVCIAGAPTNREEYRAATFEYALCAMARYQISGKKPELRPVERPVWLPTAESGLEKYIAGDTEGRKNIRLSKFFRINRRTLKMLHSITSSLILGEAQEGGFAFATSVALYETNLDLARHDAELQRSQAQRAA
jgi:hypothetical protein